MRKIYIILLFLIVSSMAQGQSIFVMDDNVCCGDTFYLTISGSQLNNLGAASLFIQFDDTHFKHDGATWGAAGQYQFPSLVNPAVQPASGSLFTYNVFDGGAGDSILAISWTSIIDGVNLANDWMFKIRFISICNPMSATPLPFTFISITTPQVASCEIADINGVVLSSNFTTGSITQLPLPGTAGVISGPVSVCQNSTATYSIPAIANVVPPDYQWQVPPGASIVSGQGTTSISVLFSGTFTGQDIEVSGENSCGESGNNLPVTVLSAPSPTYASPSVTSGTAAVLTGTVSPVGPSYSYSWSPVGMLSNASQATLANPNTAPLTAPQVFTCTVTNTATGCDSVFTVLVNVTGIPLAINTATANPAQTCLGGTIALTVTAQGGSGNYLYTWGTSNAVNAPLTNPNSNTLASSTPISPGTYTFTITVTDAIGGNSVFQALPPISVYANPTGSITSQTNVLCFGNNTGSVTVAGAAGTAPYSYSINGGGTFQMSGTFSSLIAANYTIIVKDAHSCTVNVPVTITQPIAPLNASITSGPVNVLCFGQSTGSVTITATAGSGTAPYQYSIDGGLTYQGSGLFTGLAANNYTVTVRDANGCLKTQSFVITQPAAALAVSVTETDNSGSANNDNIICAGASATIGATSTGGTPSVSYSWNQGLGAGASHNVTPASTLTYIVTATDGNGCSDTEPITITVNPVPVVTNAANSTICSGSSTNINLTASVPSSFTWTIGTIAGGITGASAGSGSLLNQVLTNPSNAAAGSVEYVVTPTSTAGACVGSPYTITVVVNPKPVVTTANTASTCSGTSPNISLTASVPSSFSWTIGTITGGITGASPSFGAAINQVLTNPSNASSGTVEYVVTPTSTTGTCPGTPYTITVTVNPKPAMTTANTASVCSGAGPAISLTASTPSNFAWTLGTITGGITGASAGSGATINQVLTNPGNTTAGTVQYIVTPTSTTGSCPGNPLTITVTVNPIPLVTNAATLAICSGSSPNINLTSSTAASFTWTIGTISGGITGASAGSGSLINQVLTNPGNASAGTVEYIITPTSTTGTCTGAPYTITVTVNPKPVVTTANTAAICSGTGPNISLTASVPSSFTWTIGTITGGITGATANAGSLINQVLTNPSNASAGSVAYIVTPTSTTGACIGNPYTITVTVNPKPAVTNPTTLSICSGTGPNINLTATAASTFSWTIGTITGGITGASAGSGSVINQILTNPGNSSSGTVQYIVTPTSTTGSCQGNPLTITVTVNPLPIVTNAATLAICSGTSPNINLTSSTPSSFSWTLGTITGGITGASAGSGALINQILTNPGNTTAGTVEYIITPTSSTGTCIGAPYTITVTVNPKPVVTNANTATICSGTGPNISLTASVPSSFTWTIGPITGGITGATANAGSLINQVLTNPSNSAPGTVAYIITPTSTTGTCIGNTYTITVTVNPKPVVTNPAALSICSGNGPNINLAATAASTFSWTIGTISGGITGASAGTGSVINQVLTNPGNSTAGSVQYIVTPTSTTGTCQGNPFTITVTVNPIPLVTNAATLAICSGTSPNINLTSSTPSSFTWTIGTIIGGITGASAGSGALINQILTNPDNTTAGTVEYIITPTSTTGACIGAAYTITVTVNPKAVVTNPNTATICSGTGPNISLTASVASSFSWTIGTITGGITGASAGSGALINQVLTNPGNLTAGTVAYIITPTSTTGTCPGTPYTITITVNPKPVVTNPAAISICSGTGPNINLSASVASTFTWTIGTIIGGITGASADSGPVINQVLTNPGNSTAGSVQYIVTPTSNTGSCIGLPYTITVTVNPLPVVTNAATLAICSGTSPNINLTSSAPGSFAWTIGTIIGGVTGASAGSGSLINQVLTNPANTTAGSVEYIITPSSTTGACIGSPYTITVTVNPKPVVTNPNTATICSGTGPNINLTASVPSSFTWTIGAITGGISGSSAGSGSLINQILTNPSTTTSGTVAYIITPTSTTGTCPGNPYTITVTVNPKPVVTNPASTSICSQTSPNINLSASVAGTFTWTIGTITGGVTGASAGSGSVINQVLTNPSTSTAGSVQYIITPTASTGGCTGNPYTLTVIVNPKPIANAIQGFSIPYGTNTALSSSPVGLIGLPAYNWTPVDSIASGATTANPVTNNLTVYTVFTLVVTDGTTGCQSDPDTVQIHITGGPLDVSVSTTNNVICFGASTQINAIPQGGNPIGYTFSWTSDPIGFVSNSQVINVTPAVTTEYKVTLTDGFNNPAKDSITIVVNQLPLVNSQTATVCSDVPCNVTLAPSTSTVAVDHYNITAIVSNGLLSSAGSPVIGDNFSDSEIVDDAWTNTTSIPEFVIYTIIPVSADGCEGIPFTVTLTVEPEPIVADQSQSVCSDLPSGLSLGNAANVAASTYNITGISTNGMTASAGNPTFPANGVSATEIANDAWTNTTTLPLDVIYTVVPVSGNNCSGNPFIVTLTINPEPLVGPQIGTSCSDVPSGITLDAGSAVPASTYNVTNILSGGLTASAGNPVTGTNLPANTLADDAWTNTGSATVSVVYQLIPVSAAGCAGNPFTVTLNIDPEPVIANQTPATCSDVASGFILGPSSGIAATSYNITGINPNGLTSAAGNPVTGNAFPDSEIADDVWTNTSNTSVNVVYTIVPVSSAGCLGNAFTVSLTVDPEPLVANQTLTICSDVVTALNLGSSTTVTASTYNITAITATGLTASAGNPTFPVTGVTSAEIANDAWTNTGSVPVDVVYTVEPVSGVGCKGDSFTVTLTIDPEPVVTDQTALTCSDVPSGITLSSSSSVAATSYNILGIASSGLTASAGSPAPTTGATDNVLADDAWTNTGNAPVTVTYTIVPVSAAGCIGDAFTVSLSIAPEPVVANIVQGGCSEQTTAIILSAGTSVAAVTYDITNINSNGLIAFAGNPITGTNFPNTEIADDAWTHDGMNMVSVVYTIVPVSAGLCAGNPFTVTLNIDPEPAVVDQSAIVCSDVASNVTLNASTTVAAATYNIISINSNGLTASAGSPAIGTSLADNVIANDAWTNTGFLAVDVIYTIRPVSVAGCIGEPFDVTLTINPEPLVANQSVTLCSDQPSGLILNPSTSVAAATYDFAVVNSNGLTASAGSPGTGTGYDNAVISDDAWTNTTPLTANVVHTVVPVSADGCSGNPFFVTFVVNPEPAGQAGTWITCSGAALNFDLQGQITNNLGSSFSWVATDNPDVSGESTLPQTGAFITDNLVNVVASNQTVVYTVTPTSLTDLCVGNSFAVTVTVNALPTVNAGPDQDICQGSVASLNAILGGSATTGSWTANPTGGTFSSLSSPTATFTPAAGQTGPIVLTFTSNDPDGPGPCFSTTDQLTVNVFPIPVVNIQPVQPICQGTCVQLQGLFGGGATSAAWSDGGVGGIFTLTPNPMNPTYCPPANYNGTITISLTSDDPTGPCNAMTTSVSLLVYSLPASNPAQGYSIPYGTFTSFGCTPTNLVGTPSFSWTPIDSISAGASSASMTTKPMLEFTIFTIVVTDGTTGCQSPPDTVEIHIIGGPLKVNITSADDTICLGEQTTLTANAQGGNMTYTYNWSSVPAGFTSTVAAPVVSPTTTTIYTVTVFDNFNFANSLPFTVTVNQLPAVNNQTATTCPEVASNVVLGSSTNAVPVDHYNITAITTNGLSPTAGSPAIGNNLNSTVLSDDAWANNSTNPVNVVYTLVPVSAAGCPGAPFSVTLTVNPMPLVTNSDVSGQYCPSVNTPVITLTSNVINATYNWTNDNTTIGLAASGSGLTFPSFFAVNNGVINQVANIQVTATANACTGPVHNYSIVIYPNPVVNPIADQVKCVGESSNAVVFGSNIGFTTYIWVNNTPAIGLPASSGGNATGIPAFITTNAGSTPLVGSIQVTPSANTCTGPIETFTITVNPLPIMNPPADITVCLADPAFALSGATPAGGTYTGTGVSSGTFTPATAGAGTHTITYTFTDVNGCTNSTTFLISVNSITAGTIAADQTICSGDVPATLFETVAATGGGALSYVWEEGSSATGPWSAVVPAATGSTYSPPALTVGTWYRRVVSSTVNGFPCTAPSNAIHITINDVAAGLSGSDQTICNNTIPAILNELSAGTGSGVLTYQWQSSTNAGVTWTDISGATGVTFTPAALLADTWYRRLVFSTLNGKVCSATGNDVIITVNNVTSSTIEIQQTICNGSAPTLFTETGGSTGDGTLTYQWQYALSATGPWTDISLATGSSYQAPALFVDTWYRRVVISTLNGVNCSINSNEIKIQINNVSPGVIGNSQTICSGAVPNAFTFTTTPAGSGVITYQWQIGTSSTGPWNDISGAINATYTPPALTVDTWYQCVVTSTLAGVQCGATTNALNISINNVSAAVIAADEIICSGQVPACLTVPTPPTGSGNLSYQWQNSTNAGTTWTDITGANTLAYCPPALSVDTWYRLVTTSLLGGVPCKANSNAIHITINNVTAGSVAVSQTICNGGIPSAFTSVNATGTGTISYQWQSGSSATGPWTSVAGATTATYTPLALTLNTWYRRLAYSVLTTDTCTATSNVIAITINYVTAGYIGSDTTICSGTIPPAFTIDTAATGTGILTYQWYSATSAGGTYSQIAGATNASYSPPALTVSRWYYRIVTSTLNGVPCTATSNIVAVTVNDVTASVIGSDQTICSGIVPNVFTVTTAASGTGTITYQWQQSTTSATGPWTGIAGATNNTHGAPALTVSTWYRVVVTSTHNGISCSANSNVVKVTINTINPGTTINPQTICSGTAPAQLTYGVASTAAGSLSYQWQQSTTGTPGTWSNIPGAVGVNYTPPVLTVNTWYRKIVYSTLATVVCSDTTNAVMITINTVTAGTIAADQTICSGDIPACLTLPIGATGTGTLSYQWQSKTSLPGAWTNIGGATGVSYCPPALTVTTWYQIVVTSTLNSVPCSASTNAVKITINNVTAGVMAASQAICNGSIPAPFTVGTAATGSGALSYQWQSGTSATGPWTPIAGATASTYSPPALTANAWYRRIVMSVLNTDTCWATGNVLAITINNVTSGVVAGDQTICSGTAPLSFTVTTAATGTGVLTYQWQQGPCPVGPFVNIVGATSATYSPPALTLNTGYRRVTTSTLSGVGCIANSNTICITINNVTAGTIAADQTICNGDDPVPFTAGAAATGSGTLTYQWQIASAAGGPWNDIAGATATTYDPPAQTTDKWFRRVVTSTFNTVACNAISNVLKVTINNVNAGTIGNNQTICSGSAPAALTAVIAATGGGTLSYQWQNANAATGPFGNITGATNASYTAPALTADKWYQLIVTSTLNGKTCSDTTNIIKVTVNSVTASVITASQTICSGSAPAGFTETTAATGTGTLSYQWQSAPSASGPWTNITGATSANYSAPVLTASVWYQSIVTSNLSSVNCSATSNIIAVTVNPPPTANPGIDTTICRNLSLNNTWATATNFSSVVWTSNGDGSFNNSGNLHPIYTPGTADITTGSVLITMTVNGVPPCGSVSASFTLYISDFTIAYAGPDTTICEGMSYVIDSSGMYNATSVTWSSNGSGTFDNITLLHPTYTPSAADVANGFVILSVHAVNSLLFCGDSTDTMILNIKPYPITNAGPDIYLCLGDSAQLSASGGTSFVWNPSAGLSDPTIGNPWAKPMTTTLYTVIATLNGCSKPDQILVTVYPLPVVSAGPDRGICAGDETELTATGAYSYAWSDGKSTQSIIVSPGSTTVYYVTGTDYHGCTNIDGVVVTVNQLPVINISPTEAYICRDSTVRLQASGASTYKWFPVAGLTAPVGPIVWASPVQSTIYTVTGTDMNGCKNDKQVSIRVYPTPELLLPDSAYVCDGVDYNLIAGYNDSTSYVWQDGSTNPLYTVTKPGFYWVIATNPACSAMDTVTVRLCTKLWVPNAFTPDGNTVNDIFYAYSSTDLVKFEMFIFTRWGEVIFESKDIDKGWDGNFQGSPCPMGVYTYLIRYKGQANDAANLEGEITGIVNLIR